MRFVESPWTYEVQSSWVRFVESPWTYEDLIVGRDLLNHPGSTQLIDCDINLSEIYTKKDKILSGTKTRERLDIRH